MCDAFNIEEIYLFIFFLYFDHTVDAVHLFTLGHTVLAPVSLRPPSPKAQYALIGQL